MPAQETDVWKTMSEGLGLQIKLSKVGETINFEPRQGPTLAFVRGMEQWRPQGENEDGDKISKKRIHQKQR